MFYVSPGDEPDPGYDSVHPDAAPGGGSLTHSGLPCLSPPPAQRWKKQVGVEHVSQRGQKQFGVSQRGQKQLGVSQRGQKTVGCITERAKNSLYITERAKNIWVYNREGKNS